MDPANVFGVLPETLAAELVQEYSKIVTAFAERRWEQSELDAGRLCEVVYTVIVGYLEGGNYPARASKPGRFAEACFGLESKYQTHGGRSARVLIPRMMIGVYDIRNNRGVGHAGGDVDSNEMDATAALYVSKWLMAELVRLLHDLPLDEAQQVVDTIVEREVPSIWIQGDKRRVLYPDLSWGDKILLLLSSESRVRESDLQKWLEHKRIGDLRKTLRVMHGRALLDYDEETRIVQLTPPGVEAAEEVIRKVRLERRT